MIICVGSFNTCPGIGYFSIAVDLNLNYHFPFYLVLIYALVRARNWVRVPALLYGAAIVYSTVVYFGYEVLDAANRAEADLLAVFLVNIPFTIVPLILMWRMRYPRPFRGP